jgi:hypothetical protein
VRLLLVPIVLATACGGMQDPSNVEQQEGACLALEGLRFATITELECGRGPDSACKWQLEFLARDDIQSAFTWSFTRSGDVGESGLIECHGSQINSMTNRPITGTFDPVSRKLVWENQTYVPQ